MFCLIPKQECQLEWLQTGEWNELHMAVFSVVSSFSPAEKIHSPYRMFTLTSLTHFKINFQQHFKMEIIGIFYITQLLKLYNFLSHIKHSVFLTRKFSSHSPSHIINICTKSINTLIFCIIAHCIQITCSKRPYFIYSVNSYKQKGHALNWFSGSFFKDMYRYSISGI